MKIIHIGGKTTGVDRRDSGIPQSFQLQNYPNPFNPTTTIQYTVTRASRVQIEIYNQMGQFVRLLKDELTSPGNYTIPWNGKNDRGKTVASGIYIYQMVTDKKIDSNKMLLIR